MAVGGTDMIIVAVRLQPVGIV
jgi:hypothetical protein